MTHFRFSPNAEQLPVTGLVIAATLLAVCVLGVTMVFAVESAKILMLVILMALFVAAGVWFGLMLFQALGAASRWHLSMDEPEVPQTEQTLETPHEPAEDDRVDVFEAIMKRRG